MLVLISNIYRHEKKTKVQGETKRMHWVSPSQVSTYLTLTDRGSWQESGGLDYVDSHPEEGTKIGPQYNGANRCGAETRVGYQQEITCMKSPYRPSRIPV